jgi:phage shock protein A
LSKTNKDLKAQIATEKSNHDDLSTKITTNANSLKSSVAKFDKLISQNKDQISKVNTNLGTANKNIQNNKIKESSDLKKVNSNVSDLNKQ